MVFRSEILALGLAQIFLRSDQVNMEVVKKEMKICKCQKDPTLSPDFARHSHRKLAEINLENEVIDYYRMALP